jgi:tripartite-type tricarboxylate transporter receptor subunit TctC
MQKALPDQHADCSVMSGVNAAKLPRRKFLDLAAGAASLPAMSRTYPTRPITMVVSFAAGGPADALARVLAERMRGSLAQPIVIENVTGAGGTIGTGRVARGRPDGYTIDSAEIPAMC